MFRLNTGFFLLHQAWAKMSVALGPFSWQTLGDNFVCLTILIDLEEVSLICLHYVDEFYNLHSHFCLILYFMHSAIAGTWGLYFSVSLQALRDHPFLSSPGNLQIGKLKLQNFSLLSNLLCNLCYFLIFWILLVTNMSILYNSRITKKFLTIAVFFTLGLYLLK